MLLLGGGYMTKRILTFIVLFVVTSMSMNAQLIRGYGLKLGAVSATQIWDYKIDVNFPTERSLGIDVGAFIEVLEIPYVSVLVELHYIQKGFSFTSLVTTPAQPMGTGEYITKKPRVDYLSIPLFAKLRFDIASLYPYVIVGPRWDFLIAKVPEGTQNVLDNFKSTDFGVSIGGGIEVSLPVVSAALVEFRYSPSFNEAFSNMNLSVKNQSFELLLGVRM